MVLRKIRSFFWIVRRPSDLMLLVAVGRFIKAAPARIERTPWVQLLDELRAVKVMRVSAERVMRVRTFWLSKKRFAAHNTCYIRALTLYRFLDSGDGELGLHLGIEHRSDKAERLHGHAWVTLGERIVEGPPAALEGRIREIGIRAAR